MTSRNWANSYLFFIWIRDTPSFASATPTPSSGNLTSSCLAVLRRLLASYKKINFFPVQPIIRAVPGATLRGCKIRDFQSWNESNYVKIQTCLHRFQDHQNLDMSKLKPAYTGFTTLKMYSSPQAAKQGLKCLPLWREKGLGSWIGLVIQVEFGHGRPCRFYI